MLVSGTHTYTHTNQHSGPSITNRKAATFKSGDTETQKFQCSIRYVVPKQVCRCIFQSIVVNKID